MNGRRVIRAHLQRERCYAGAHARLQQLRKHARGYPMVPVAFAHAGVNLRAMAHARPPWPRKPAQRHDLVRLLRHEHQRVGVVLHLPEILPFLLLRDGQSLGAKRQIVAFCADLPQIRQYRGRILTVGRANR